MTGMTRCSAAIAAAASAVVLFACGGDSGGNPSREVELAPKGAASPKFADEPSGSGIRKLLGLGARTGTIRSGTALTVNLSERVCTNTHRVGSSVTASVRETVRGSNRAVVPAGSPVALRVTESARSENSKDNVRLAFTVTFVTVGGERHTAEGRVTREGGLELVRAQSTGDQAKKIGAGAAVGAIAGQVLGKDTRSTVTGAVVGAAAGTAVAVGTADYDGCLPRGASLGVVLTSPLTVKVSPVKATTAGT